MVPIEERLAIEELARLYPLFCDTHQFEKLFELFTDECLFDETSVGAPLATSRSAIRDLFRKAYPIGPMIHICTDHIISAYSGDTASGTCHVVAEGIKYLNSEEYPFRIFGYYDDRYAKVDGRWYFAARVLKLLVPSQGKPTVGGIRYDLAADHFALR